MQWADVLRDQSLQDLPYKIELNEWGQIVMSPASNRHASLQGEVYWILRNRMAGGKVLTECSVETDAGVKVLDVAWCSSEFFQKQGFTTPYPEAPELCVEIVSPSNSDRQLREKMALYFRRGAKECWLVSEEGRVRFFSADGEQERSGLLQDIGSVLTWDA
ncbi:MAG: Uma2 family endonuclease [Magnetococcales bacterium]|nr:Uma2 family endonuclease [Magnetococcales bacterium]